MTNVMSEELVPLELSMDTPSMKYTCLTLQVANAAYFQTFVRILLQRVADHVGALSHNATFQATIAVWNGQTCAWVAKAEAKAWERLNAAMPSQPQAKRRDFTAYAGNSGNYRGSVRIALQMPGTDQQFYAMAMDMVFNVYDQMLERFYPERHPVYEGPPYDINSTTVVGSKAESTQPTISS